MITTVSKNFLQWPVEKGAELECRLVADMCRTPAVAHEIFISMTENVVVSLLPR